MNKRGIANVIVVIILILIAFLCVILYFSIVKPILVESASKVDLNQFSNNVKFSNGNFIYNKNESKIQFSVIREGNLNISYIKAIIFSNNLSLRYNLIDVPNNFETLGYVINTSGINEIQEILIYPVFTNGKIGIGERKKFSQFILGEVNSNLKIIDPIINDKDNCNPNFQCNEYSKCSVYYDLNSLNTNILDLKSEMMRTCFDKNNCASSIIEREECNDNLKVVLKKVSLNGNNYVEVYDTNNNLLSRLQLIPGEQNVLNIEVPV